MANKQFDYTKRNFAEIRTELVNYVKQYYPTIIQDFSDESLGMLLLELVAGVGDIMSQNLDNVFNETQLKSAQLFSSVLNIAKNLGVNVGNKKASSTIIDVRIRVPVKGDTYNRDYCPLIRQGMIVSGGGKDFETITEIDFNSQFNSQGIPNLLVLPQYDSNQRIFAYDLVKREIVLAGVSKIERFYINTDLYKPFLEIQLSDQDIVNIEEVITLVGNINSIPSITDFLVEENKWYEVDYLAQQYITVIDTNFSINDQYTPTKVKKITRKFIKEFDTAGRCKLIFGAGTNEDRFDEIFSGTNMSKAMSLYVDNYSLGEIPNINTTMFVRYRTGGGATSLANAGVINSVKSATFIIGGSSETTNQAVRNSLSVTNQFPALGGSDRLGIEAIRNLVSYNYASQGRAVTLPDYYALIMNMPGEFGSPYKLTPYLENNKIVLSILGLDADGKLDNRSNSILKTNIKNYLMNKRMINDYVEIKDGRIYNLAFDYDILVNDSIRNQNEMASLVIQEIINFFDISKNEMNTDIYLDDLNMNIKNIGGIISIMNYRVYNKVGNGYSINRSSIPLLIPNDPLGELQIVNNILYSDKDSMFEIKYPNKDIRITFKRRRELS